MDFFQNVVVASPVHYARTFFFLKFWDFAGFWLFYEYFFDFVNIGRYGNKTPPSNRLCIFSNFFWIFFSVVLKKVVLWVFEILSLPFFTILVFVSMGRKWEPKVLLNFFSVRLIKVLFWIFEILNFWFLANFWKSPWYTMRKPKTSFIWKTSDRRAKRSEIWVPKACIQCIQVHTSTKTAGRRAKRNEIWDSGVVFNVYMVVWYLVLKVILVEFPIFDNLVSRQWLVVGRNWVKFGPQGWVFSVYMTHVKLNALGNSGVIRCISDSQQPCISKTVSLRAKHTHKSLCYPVLCGYCLTSCQAERQSPWASCFWDRGLSIWDKWT